MRWTVGRRSQNIEDRRGMGGGGGFGGSAVRVGGAGGIGVVVLALVAMFFGVDPSVVLNSGLGGGGGYDPGSVQYERPTGGAANPQEAQREEFVSNVLADTEETWNGIFQAGGAQYAEPRLVLFSGAVQSACGAAGSSTGPFYCPADQKVYLDLSFFDELERKFGAPGDFAQAYVVAHEIGHHVQTLLGTSRRVNEARRQVSQEEGNMLSVAMELQADCYAGVWANNADRAGRVQFEAGDLEEGLRAAAAVGDDRIQRRSQGYVVPESFTHGSSEQRVRWFRQGLQSGDVNSCDTFSARSF